MNSQNEIKAVLNGANEALTAVQQGSSTKEAKFDQFINKVTLANRQLHPLGYKLDRLSNRQFTINALESEGGATQPATLSLAAHSESHEESGSDYSQLSFISQGHSVELEEDYKTRNAERMQRRLEQNFYDSDFDSDFESESESLSDSASVEGFFAFEPDTLDDPGVLSPNHVVQLNSPILARQPEPKLLCPVPRYLRSLPQATLNLLAHYPPSSATVSAFGGVFLAKTPNQNAAHVFSITADKISSDEISAGMILHANVSDKPQSPIALMLLAAQADSQQPSAEPDRSCEERDQFDDASSEDESFQDAVDGGLFFPIDCSFF